MHLGAFSVSLAVKNLTTSKTFYEAIGFETLGGDAAAGWLMLKSGDTVLGLFQGMLEKNTLTFNPGWDQSAQLLDDFMDVRAIQANLQSKGLTLDVATDPKGTGPAHIVLTDPDGNPVLIDQHR